MPILQIPDMFRRDAGQFCDPFGDRRSGPEFFVRPDVHCLTRHADGAGSVGDGVAGDLGEDVAHGVAQLMDERAKLMLERRDCDRFRELVELMMEVFHRVAYLSYGALDTSSELYTLSTVSEEGPP
jgi:hypothetical protein